MDGALITGRSRTGTTWWDPNFTPALTVHRHPLHRLRREARRLASGAAIARTPRSSRSPGTFQDEGEQRGPRRSGPSAFGEQRQVRHPECGTDKRSSEVRGVQLLRFSFGVGRPTDHVGS